MMLCQWSLIFSIICKGTKLNFRANTKKKEGGGGGGGGGGGVFAFFKGISWEALRVQISETQTQDNSYKY
jgi:hypothetical protein